LQLSLDRKPPLVRELVERAVLDRADVRDDGHLEGRVPAPRAGCADDQRRHECNRKRDADPCCTSFHVPSLRISLPPLIGRWISPQVASLHKCVKRRKPGERLPLFDAQTVCRSASETSTRRGFEPS